MIQTKANPQIKGAITDSIYINKKAVLEVSADLLFAANVRDFAADFFRIIGFNSTWQYRLKLVVDELFMNAVMYGSKAKDTIITTIKELDKGVEVIIDDCGAKHKKANEIIQKIKQEKANKNPIKTSGRGLSIITKNWTDSFKIEQSSRGGIKVVFFKSLGDRERHIDPVAVPAYVQQKAQKQTGFKPLIGQRNIISVSFDGEIDEFNLKDNIGKVKKIIESQYKNIELDLVFERLTYVNSLFIGQIAKWHNELKAQGNLLKLVKVPADIMDILELVGLAKIIPIQKI